MRVAARGDALLAAGGLRPPVDLPRLRDGARVDRRDARGLVLGPVAWPAAARGVPTAPRPKVARGETWRWRDREASRMKKSKNVTCKNGKNPTLQTPHRGHRRYGDPVPGGTLVFISTPRPHKTYDHSRIGNTALSSVLSPLWCATSRLDCTLYLIVEIHEATDERGASACITQG